MNSLFSEKQQKLLLNLFNYVYTLRDGNVF